MPTILIRNQVLADVAFPVETSVALVGRGPETHVRIEDSTISRVHARLERTAGGWTLVDLDSRNGTFVNGERIADVIPIRDGDALRFGGVDAAFVGSRSDAAPPPRVRSAAGDPVAPPTATVPTTPAANARAATGRRANFFRDYRGVVVGLIAGILVAVFWNVFRSTTNEDSPLDPPRDAAPPTIEAPPPNEDAPRPPKPSEVPSPAEKAPPTVMPGMNGMPDETVSTEETENAAGTATEESTSSDSPAEPAETPSKVPMRPTTPDAEDETFPPPEPTPAPPPARVESAEPATPPPTAAAKPPAPTREPTIEERVAFRRLAYDLLGRPPREQELREWAPLSREALVDRLLADPEHWESWFEDELYEFLLIDEFRPGPDRMNGLPRRMAASELTIPEALAEIAKSQQFNARNPGNDTYVTVVLEQFLGLTVQSEPTLLEAGKRMYDGRAATFLGKSGRSQSDLVDLVSADRRFAPRYVARKAAALLGSEPKRVDLVRWARIVVDSKDGFRAMQREILLSPAWEQGLKTPRKKSDRRFMTGLWCDVFDRAPDYQELRNLRNASQALTDPTGLRSVVIGSILGSDAANLPEKASVDAARWISDAFVRLLARTPTQSESKAFLEAWSTEACRPSTILHALLTSAEYDHY